MIQINTENKIIVGDMKDVRSETIDILYMIYNRTREKEGKEAAMGVLLDMVIKTVKKKNENMIWEPDLAEMLKYTD